jgi:hypothetical protein
MKKLLFLVVCFSSFLIISSSASALPLEDGENNSIKKGGFGLKAGIDVMGKVDNDIEDEGDAEMGFCIGGEYVKQISDSVVFGGGVIYQLPRGVDESNSLWEDTTFSYIPIYGLFRLFFNADKVTPYATIHLGYNFVTANDLPGDVEVEGGFYWGIGGGVIFTNGFFAEVVYSVNNGVLSSAYFDIESDTDYKKITIAAGKIF